MRFAQNCILDRFRKQTFFSLAGANAAIAEAVERINGHVMHRLGVCRRHLCETMERPALASLPAQDYEFAEWRFARVSTDYHIEFERYFYSMPHNLIRHHVDVRATSRTIEVFSKGQRVAAHRRRFGGSRFGTDRDHLASSHRRYADCRTDRRGPAQPPASETGLEPA